MLNSLKSMIICTTASAASLFAVGKVAASDLVTGYNTNIYTYFQNVDRYEVARSTESGVLESYGAITATGANQSGTPFTYIRSSSNDVEEVNQSAETWLYYQWRVVGSDPDVPVLVHAKTVGWIDASYGFSPFALNTYNFYTEGLSSVIAAATFTNNTPNGAERVVGGYNSGRYNYGAARLDQTGSLDTQNGGTVFLRTTFLETRDFWITPNLVNTVFLQAGSLGFIDQSGLLFDYARAFYDVKAYVDPVFTIDAAYADRYQLDLPTIPFAGVAAVPEASSYALMLGGLLMTCLATRNSRRT